jgi:hypothetical protein
MDERPHETGSGFFRPAVLAVLLILSTYLLSFGPACWLTSQVIVGGFVAPHPVMRIYWPLGALASNTESPYGAYIHCWMTLGLQEGQSAIVPMSFSGPNSLAVQAN